MALFKLVTMRINISGSLGAEILSTNLGREWGDRHQDYKGGSKSVVRGGIHPRKAGTLGEDYQYGVLWHNRSRISTGSIVTRAPFNSNERVGIGMFPGSGEALRIVRSQG